MKKAIYMFVAALGLVSCSQEEIIENNLSSAAICASLPVDSRVSLDGLFLCWEAGDQFMGFQAYKEQGQGKQTTGTAYEIDATYANATTAYFNPIDGQAADYAVAYGVYPKALNPMYNGDGTTGQKTNWDTMEKYEVDNGDGTFTITLPEGNANLGTDAPMYGTSFKGKITFKLVTGMLKIDLSETDLDKAKVNGVTVTTKDLALCGDTKITQHAGKYGQKFIYAETIQKEGANVMTVPSTCAVNYVYYIPIPKGTYPEIKISATDGTRTVEETFTNAEINFATMYKVFEKKTVE